MSAKSIVKRTRALTRGTQGTHNAQLRKIPANAKNRKDRADNYRAFRKKHGLTGVAYQGTRPRK